MLFVFIWQLSVKEDVANAQSEQLTQDEEDIVLPFAPRFLKQTKSQGQVWTQLSLGP